MIKLLTKVHIMWHYFMFMTIYGVDSEHDTPYMTRIRFGTPDGASLRLHMFHRGDADRDPHNHPWNFWTFPLTTYIEEETFSDDIVINAKKRNIVRAWRWHYRPSSHLHRVLARGKERAIMREQDDGGWLPGKQWQLVPGIAWTIIITGPKINAWGFLKIRDDGTCFVPWKEYIFAGGKHAPCEPDTLVIACDPETLVLADSGKWYFIDPDKSLEWREQIVQFKRYQTPVEGKGYWIENGLEVPPFLEEVA